MVVKNHLFLNSNAGTRRISNKDQRKCWSEKNSKREIKYVKASNECAELYRINVFVTNTSITSYSAMPLSHYSF